MKFRLTTTCVFNVTVVEAATMKPGEYSILDEFPSRVFFQGDILDAVIYYELKENTFDLHLNDGSRGYMLLGVAKELFEPIKE